VITIILSLILSKGEKERMSKEMRYQNKGSFEAFYPIERVISSFSKGQLEKFAGIWRH
jgi:hypothetical protein